MPAEWAGRPVLVRWQLKRPMYDFKNSLSSAFVTFVEQNVFFLETYFAYPISKQKFTVWREIHYHIMMWHLWDWQNHYQFWKYLIYFQFVCQIMQPLSQTFIRWRFIFFSIMSVFLSIFLSHFNLSTCW